MIIKNVTMKCIILLLLVLCNGYGFAQIAGDIDPTFAVANGFSTQISCITMQPDSKFIIGGNFTGKIARINSNGNGDATFNVGTGFNNTSSVMALALQADGRVIVGGAFTTYNGLNSNRIARLNINGTIDTSFHVGSGFNAFVKCISIQPDGKILVVGNFTTYNGISAIRIVRLNINGSFDTSFNLGQGFDITPYALEIQSDGKILVAGNFTSYNNSVENYIVRLNADGFIDSTFNSNGIGVDYYVHCIKIQPDNKILIGGDFTDYNGVGRNRIARINSDGSLDVSFNLSGANFAAMVNCIEIQKDRNIIVVGDFAKRIIRLKHDGSFDSSLNVGSGFDNIVNCVLVQPNRKIVACGSFLNYNSISSNYATRILNPGIQIDSLINDNYCALDTFKVSFVTTGTFNSNNIFKAQLSSSTGSFTNPTILGTITNTGSDTITCILPSTLSSGLNKLRIVSTSPVVTGNDYDYNLTIHALPTPVIVQSGNILSSDSLIYNQYQWFLNDTLIIGETSPNYLALQNGQYKLQVTTIDGCQKISNTYNLFTVGALSNNLNKIGIFPNPSNTGLFKISLNNKDYSINIFNSIGENIYSSNVLHQENIEVNISSQPIGIYFVKVASDKVLFYQKIIKN